MPIVQLSCPETGWPIDLGEVPPGAHIAGGLWWSMPITCPHCGKEHPFASREFILALEALYHSPDASRVLVDREAGSITSLP
jgi:hypothetical protein